MIAAALLLLAAVPFFNGKDLREFFSDTPGIWKVAPGGVITGQHSGLKHNDFLRTRRHYSDFELRLKFRLKDGKGNSGIQFRSKPVPDSHEVSGYQADIGEKYWGCLYDESRRNRVLACPKAEQLKFDPSGWNEYVITARGPRITLELNGVKTVDYTETEPNIDGSGFIALQVHSGPGIAVEFKDLQITELKE